jgi:hypothetical protein
MTIRDDIQLKMIILESKIDLAIITDKDNQVPNRPDMLFQPFELHILLTEGRALELNQRKIRVIT